MDLKGPAYSAETLSAVAEAAAAGEGCAVEAGAGCGARPGPRLLCILPLPSQPPNTRRALPLPRPAAVGATPHVALFVSSEEQLRLAQAQERWRGPLIHAFLDQADPNPPVSVQALQPYALLGPSIKARAPATAGYP